MCLPLAHGERQGNRRKLLLHLLWAEAAAPSPLFALSPAAAPRRPEPPRSHSPHPRSRETRQRGRGLRLASAPGVRVPARAERGRLQQQPGMLRSAPRALLLRRLFLSDLQF